MNHILNNASKHKPLAFHRSAGALLVMIVTMGWSIPAHSEATTAARVPAATPKQALATAPAKARVYGHSVIPGGVQGASELTVVLARDKITRAHFANFDTANAYVVQAPSARRVHVSYRMGNAIYWTKNKVLIAKGETLLTDGKTFVRARCGNRIADVAQSTVSNMEPAPAMLDTVLAQPPAVVSLTNNAPATSAPRQAPRLQTSNGVSNGLSNSLSSASGNALAPTGTQLASQAQPSTPLSGAAGRQAVAARTPSLATAGPAQDALVQVKALVPALAAAIDNELFAVLVTTSPVSLTPSAPSMPIRELLAGPLPGSGAGTSAPSGNDLNAALGIAQALPSNLSDLGTAPTVLAGAANETELPEPGSIALMLLALMLFAGMRQRNARKKCKLI